MQTKEIIERFSKAQNSLVIQQSDFSLRAVYDMVTGGAIDISPHYQRRDRWSADKQSALIESFLLNVPVPPIFLSEDEYGEYSVIDGKQRITAICDFLNGSLRLKDLDRFVELEGYYYDDLPSPLQNALLIRPYMRVTTLLKQSDPLLKYEVFLRLNTGGDSLKPQEIRNVAYSGPLNDMLHSLSEEAFLKDRLKITGPKSAAYRNMDDVEHVLRFFVLKERWQAMGNSLSHAMDDFMTRHRNLTGNIPQDHFVRALQACHHIWGAHAFHKPTGTGWRDQLISPLYDSQMIAISLLNDNEVRCLRNNAGAVIHATRELFESNDAFAKSVTQGTNTPSAVRLRISLMHEVLRRIANN